MNSVLQIMLSKYKIKKLHIENDLNIPIVDK